MAKEEAASTTGTGTDTLEIKQVDPNAARKAIMNRHSAIQQAEREIDLAQVPGAAALQGGYEAEGSAETTDGETEGESAVQQPRATETVETPAEAVVASAAAAQTAAEPETVTLKVFGKEIVEPKDKVEAAGGVEARQMELAAEERLRRANEQAQDAERLARTAADKRRAYEAKLKELTHSQARPAERAAAATPTGPTDSRPADPTTAAAGEQESLYDEIVTALYSGKPDLAREALKALSEVSRKATVDQPAIDVSKISELVQAKVDADLAARDHERKIEEQRQAVNELMATQYSAVLTDPTLRADCAHLYNAALKDPRNQGRPWVVIADEVAQRVLGRTNPEVRASADVQQELNTRKNFKRRIPAPSQATERVPAQAAEPKYPTKPSDVVNMMRAARHQPQQ